MTIEFINEIYAQAGAYAYPSIGDLLMGFPNELYGYIIPGEYSKHQQPTVDWEQNFTFLWLILVIEGYEK